MRYNTLTLAFAAFAAISAPAQAEMQPCRLRCEYLKNPVAIDVQPRLSWALTASERKAMQKAYQILVASSEAVLNSDHGDLWDTGKVDSGESINIPYSGKVLPSGTAAFWKVRVWDGSKQPGPYSKTACWEMGLLRPSDWQGKWISDSRPLPAAQEKLYDYLPAPLFRNQFVAKGPVLRARAYVSGLGYYVMSLNGKRVGDHVLDPAWTSYGKRVLYSSYDVTRLIGPGQNAVGIEVGNGWYNPLPMRFWGWLNLREYLVIGRPRIILQVNIEYMDGTTDSVYTDESWRVNDGPCVKNNIYLGEVYDARLEIPGWDLPGFDDSSWRAVVAAPDGVGELRGQMLPPIRKTRTLQPVQITEPKPGVFIFDMGQNFAGWVTLNPKGEPGRKIQLRYGELLFPDGTLDPLTSVAGQIKKAGMGGPGAPPVAYQADVYYCKGTSFESFTPKFTWHGFRYVELTGYPGTPTPDVIQGTWLNSDVESAGSFSCSNEMFNRIQQMTRCSLASNIFSIQSDCPHRERFGYGGDMVATDQMAMFNFDMAAFYANTVRNYGDAVRPNGGLTETAPFVGIDAFKDGLGGGAGPIGWGTVQPVLLWDLYQYYGDKRLMAEQYGITRNWLKFLDSLAPGLFIENGLGDHETLAPKMIPLTSTAFYFLNANLFSKIARTLGYNADADNYVDRAASIKAAFNQRFYEPGTGRYGIATQACQSFVLTLDLIAPRAQDKVLQVLLDDIAQNKNHLTTGIFGTRYMLLALSRFGNPDVAYNIVNQKDFPGWGFMLANGATTLWEHWAFSDNVYSHNHPMFGSVSEWFYKVLAGIKPAEDAVGFNKIIIEPAIVPDLTWVKGCYDSIRGPVVSEWAVKGKRLEMHVVIPPNTSALVSIPTYQLKEIQEGNRDVQQSHGVQLHSIENGRTIFSVGSGDYHFAAPWPPPPQPKPIQGGTMRE